MVWEPPGAPQPEPQPAVPVRPARGRIVAAVVLVVAVLIGSAVVVVNASDKQGTDVSALGGPSGSPSQAPSGPVGRGRVVFSDDFGDSGSGWTTQSLPSGTTFTYGSDGYVITGSGALHHFSSAPFSVPVPQIQVSMTATQVGGGPNQSGFGVSCRRPPLDVGPASLNRYEFLVENGSRFFVERRDGELSTTTPPLLLKEGSAPAAPGARPITLTATCSTLADGRTTRLVFVVNGRTVADLTDAAPKSSSPGWLSSIVVSTTASAPSTVTVSHFEVRDASSPTT